MNKKDFLYMNFLLQKSLDGTIKFSYENGFYSVLIPQKSNKYTLCVSCQIGCNVGCKFCLSGKIKFKQNLKAEEIVMQFEDSQNYLNKKEAKITSLVFMGMGEPMLNLDNVIKSCTEINKIYSLSFSKITISTCGILPKMITFLTKKTKIQLALSLHSPFQDIRNQIMPNLKKYEINELVEFSTNYNKTRKNKLMIEYLMIKDLTDRDCDLEKLINLKFSKMTNFNLISLNTDFKLNDKIYTSSEKNRFLLFKNKLMKSGYKCFIRESRGRDIEASCGMLN